MLQQFLNRRLTMKFAISCMVRHKVVCIFVIISVVNHFNIAVGHGYS